MSNTPPTDDILTTEVGIKTHLQNSAFASHTVNRLYGGYANFTYRIHLHMPVDGKTTFILKYAPSYAAALTDTIPMPFSSERQVSVHLSLKYRILMELSRNSKRKHSDWPTLFRGQMMTIG